jgi:predicted dehydrogenase
MKKLNVAVIGCGWAGDLQMTGGFHVLTDRFDVLMCCGRGETNRHAFASRYDIPRSVGSLAEVLASPEIDVISICTPPSTHFEMIKLALGAGKHVICEKPLVGSLADVDAVMEAERQSPGRVMPIFQYRFGAAIPKLREIIQSGLAGTPYAASVETLLLRGADYYQVDWRGKFDTEWGGVLITQAIHNHDLLLHLMGPVSSVSAVTATRVNSIEVEDCAAACLGLASGAVASITATLGSTRPSTRMRLCFQNVTFERQCFDGQTSFLAGDPWSFTCSDSVNASRIAQIMGEEGEHLGGFAAQFAAFHDAIHTGGSMPVTLDDARRSIELVSALYASAKSGQRVMMPIRQADPYYHGWRRPLESGHRQ